MAVDSTRHHRAAVGTPPGGDAAGRVRVLIVVDVHLYREGIRVLLDGADDLTTVGTTGTIAEALELTQRLTPDIVLLDAGLADGTEALRRISRAGLDVRIVMLALSAAVDEVVEHAEAGADGFVTRDDGADRLLAIIRSTARGEGLCRPSVVGALLRRLHALADQPASQTGSAASATLTAREEQVVARGHTNQQIAHRLLIELSTVKNHVHNILGKLGAHDRAEAGAIARRRRSGVSI
jgi:two-component system, NarL family, nitrate/nitrite response regulator NarL